jgi:hypothetical protein
VTAMEKATSWNTSQRLGALGTEILLLEGPDNLRNFTNTRDLVYCSFASNVSNCESVQFNRCRNGL